MKLTTIASYGQPRRRDRVRVVRCIVRGEALIRVLWKEGDRRKAQSFPDTRKGTVEAKAYGEAMSDRLAAKQVQVEYHFITVRQLFERYINAKVDEWRPRTLELKRERWQWFELFVGAKTPAHLVTRERMDEFKRAFLAKHSPNQVAHHISNAISVFRFGVDRDLIPATKLLTYQTRFGKDVRRSVEMGEYSATERSKIVAALNPKDSRQWRTWALDTVFAHQASRQNATRLLEWKDVTLHESGGSIRWPSSTDKMGNEREQPFTAEVAAAFWVALGWRQKDRYEGRYVFYASHRDNKPDAPYTYQAYSHSHREAEKRAGVTHMKYRGAHGFRRGVSGDVFDATGSEHKAAEWIGDKSIRVVRDHYLLQRKERQGELAALAAKVMQPDAIKTDKATVEGGEDEG